MPEAEYNETLKAAKEVTDKHERMLRNLEDDPEMRSDFSKRLRNFNKAGQLPLEWFEDTADYIDELEDALSAAHSIIATERAEILALRKKLEKAVEALLYYANHDILCQYDDASFAKDTVAELKG